ncbi:DUF2225 domain-containing protein [Petroclostridium sp. X23]|uniref:DUF2225 domain-containing protein n=1 Tax=Petroclostridium sp. X23 TaxID=3045146 RepID=UPI0024AE7DAA|nr:DUF2225 domain-containing protein [Petroclostridium sp. X23]WHH59395.1 DUF2225 domain-containing protein [Petroclostridium sp. X23]
MKADEINDLFEGLEDLGFDDLENVSVYTKNTEEEPNKKVQERQQTDFLYDRKIVCPVCNSNITVRAVKSSSIRVVSRDSDFMIYYQDPSPMLYDSWVCVKCGYAAISAQFNHLTSTQTRLIKEKICSKWKPKAYEAIYDIDTAIERYKLALLNAIVKNAKSSEKALICLKLGWLSRLKNDNENENKFLQQALEGFIQAFEKESFPIAGLDESSATYLIGELYRRLEDNTNALLWFSRVLCNRNAKNKIKDMARDQKYLITQERNEEKTDEQLTADSTTIKKQGLFSGLFNWSK